MWVVRSVSSVELIYGQREVIGVGRWVVPLESKKKKVWPIENKARVKNDRSKQLFRCILIAACFCLTHKMFSLIQRREYGLQSPSTVFDAAKGNITIYEDVFCFVIIIILFSRVKESINNPPKSKTHYFIMILNKQYGICILNKQDT